MSGGFNFMWGIFGGVVAWIATTIIGQPIYKFISLRAEAARVLALYERHDDGGVFNDDGIIGQAAQTSILEARKRDYEACGAQLLGFSASNLVVTKVLRHPQLGKHRCNPKAAGDGLILLAACKPGSQAASTTRAKVISALKLGF